ncbi:hypothetical protein WUBG_16003 [Wuchereria bancrofti]|uniref:Uncharacterized protein n=1 Tax=Wuchereria bancrofti TaxID=6293 RepID=J9DTY5_WUCBA|nr:hypothetical protein WUBG_16003 [Wuchereria bancrofti]
MSKHLGFISRQFDSTEECLSAALSLADNIAMKSPIAVQDVGILNRINKLVGNDSLTREFAYTARDFNSSEALKYG